MQRENVVLLLSALVGLTEVFPEYGLSVFPPPGQTVESKERKDTALVRTLFATGAWTTLLYFAYQKTQNPIVLLGGLMVAYGLVGLSETSDFGNAAELTTVAWLLGWSLLTYSGLKRNNNTQLLLGYAFVLLGAYFITFGRFQRALHIDWVGRLLFLVGVMLHQNAFFKNSA